MYRGSNIIIRNVLYKPIKLLDVKVWLSVSKTEQNFEGEQNFATDFSDGESAPEAAAGQSRQRAT